MTIPNPSRYDSRVFASSVEHSYRKVSNVLARSWDIFPLKNSTDNKQGTMTTPDSYSVLSIGFIRSDLESRDEAPRQGIEGAPDAWLEVSPRFVAGLKGIAVGHEIIIIIWLHEAERDRLKVHPRGEEISPLTGVFSTRSPDRPNPLGLHRVTVRQIIGNRIRIGPMEAIDRTSVADIKPVLLELTDS